MLSRWCGPKASGHRPALHRMIEVDSTMTVSSGQCGNTQEHHLSTDDTPKTVSDEYDWACASLRRISQPVQVGQQAFGMVFDPDLGGWGQEVRHSRIVSPCDDTSIRNVLREQVVGPEYFIFCPG